MWFGAYWQLLQTSIVLGGGYTSARVDRSSNGNFFDGIVEKVDASARVTDAIVAFARRAALIRRSPPLAWWISPPRTIRLS